MSQSLSSEDLSAVFGEPISAQKITLFLPDRDREQQAVADIEIWVAAAATLLVELCSGVTLLPWANGRWQEEGRPPVEEGTRLIYSYIRNPAQFLSRINELKAFLLEFGSATNQGEVMIEFFAAAQNGELIFLIYAIPFERRPM